MLLLLFIKHHKLKRVNNFQMFVLTLLITKFATYDARCRLVLIELCNSAFPSCTTVF